jgi:hypothetical protein
MSPIVPGSIVAIIHTRPGGWFFAGASFKAFFARRAGAELAASTWIFHCPSVTLSFKGD